METVSVRTALVHAYSTMELETALAITTQELACHRTHQATAHHRTLKETASVIIDLETAHSSMQQVTVMPTMLLATMRQQAAQDAKNASHACQTSQLLPAHHATLQRMVALVV